MYTALFPLIFALPSFLPFAFLAWFIFIGFYSLRLVFFVVSYFSPNDKSSV